MASAGRSGTLTLGARIPLSGQTTGGSGVWEPFVGFEPEPLLSDSEPGLRARPAASTTPVSIARIANVSTAATIRPRLVRAIVDFLPQSYACTSGLFRKAAH